MSRFGLLCSVALIAPVVKAQYQIVKDYSGSTFFDDWNFYGNFDNLTHGNVNYLDEIDAFHDKLAFTNGAGNVIMRVDNTTDVAAPQNRNSIRISTKDQFTVGSLWIADILHVPYGCSVWPAFWSSAVEWPAGGEIDTFEAVNNESMSTMALHTAPGCVHSPNAVQSSTLINQTDCSTDINNNEGCTITNPTLASYGAAFANNGGGVYVTEFAVDGISIWFFNRSSIPSSIQGNASSVDTSTLGIPVGNWPASNCTVTEFFQPQQLVFDIALCGDFAGNAQIFAETCSGVCYDDWVLGDPSNYDNAYFEVQYVRVYGQPGELTVIQSGAQRSLSLRSVLAVVVGAIIGTIMAL
ncbi:hypothetical protein OBBRIDRAFT_793317 [Obba rivulosa]|uniref:GH16 domain-containing protein n=1 Tax=Obba rivulosa TaxID=1052685 RepID=A0A8E2AY80_9APHY|nr:hypothetical protein OBBRIDRAFT_793317 [Obba rivulosa]